MTDKTLNILMIIVVFLGTFMMISFVINYDNSVKCEEADGNWYLGKCLSKFDNIEIEL